MPNTLKRVGFAFVFILIFSAIALYFYIKHNSVHDRISKLSINEIRSKTCKGPNTKSTPKNDQLDLKDCDLSTVCGMTKNTTVECTPVKEGGDKNFCKDKCGTERYVCHTVTEKDITANQGVGVLRKEYSGEVQDKINVNIEKGKSYCLPVLEVETQDCNVYTGTRILSQGVDEDGNPTINWFCNCDNKLKWTQVNQDAISGAGNCVHPGTDWSSCLKSKEDIRNQEGNKWVTQKPDEPTYPWPRCDTIIKNIDGTQVGGKVQIKSDDQKTTWNLEIGKTPEQQGYPYCWIPSDAIVCPSQKYLDKINKSNLCTPGRPWFNPSLKQYGDWDPKDAICLCNIDNKQEYVEHKVGNDSHKMCVSNSCYPGDIDTTDDNCNCPAKGIWIPCAEQSNQLGTPQATTCTVPKSASKNGKITTTDNDRDIRIMNLNDSDSKTFSYAAWQQNQNGEFSYPCKEGNACALFLPFDNLPKKADDDNSLDLDSLNSLYPYYEWETYSECKNNQDFCQEGKKCIRDSCNPVGYYDGKTCVCTKTGTHAVEDSDNLHFIKSACLDPCGPMLNPCGATVGTQGLVGTGNTANQVHNPQFLDSYKLGYNKGVGTFGLPRGYCNVGEDGIPYCDPCYKGYRKMTTSEYEDQQKKLKKPVEPTGDRLCSYSLKTDFNGACDNDNECLSNECDEWPFPWSDKICTSMDHEYTPIQAEWEI